jgi:TonB dependent receptor
MYANPVAPVAIGSDNVAFPGYDPFSPGSGGAFGGPQNTLQFQHDVSWTKGSHLIRFGGSYEYIRDNRTDAAYQTAVDSWSYGGGLGAAVNGLRSGRFAQIEVAVNPQGKFPCAANAPASSCSLTLPVSAPNFSRSNRFHDGALYAQDYWKPRRRLAVNLGVRWEHFGVQHNGNPNLDSNWYGPCIGFADDNLGAYLRNGGLQVASGSPVGGLWKPDWKDFAPRVGVAWDVFGDGRTTFRGGYGIGYDRNFGNVTFNVIQNLPNYAVVDVPGAITTNNFGPLSGGAGTLALPQVGARIIDPALKTAYARFWSAALQRAFGQSLVYSAEYSGSKGVNLYSVSYPNQIGFGNFALGDPCSGNGDCVSQPNANYGEDVGYRGNQGFSIYHSLNNRLSVNNFLNSGVILTVNYTWSHAIDNISSTFFEAGGQGVASQYGNRNITINNGDFDLGLLDPYKPKLDRGDAEFDVRHRVTLSGNWQVPTWKKSAWMGRPLGGWSVNPIFLARSGQPFSVFDSDAQTLDLNIPRAIFVGSFPLRRNTFVATPSPDLYQIITFNPAQIAHAPNPLVPGDMWLSAMSRRDLFRAPGFWNLDLAVFKNTRITDRFTWQLRAELFNVFNHANLYVIGTSADVGTGNTVNACFGCSRSTYDRRQTQFAAKIIF